MLIPKFIFSISRLCGGIPGRFALNHVKVARTKDGPLAVATNESSIVIAAWKEQDANDFPPCDGSAKRVKGFERLVPTETWAEVSGMIPKKRASLQSALLDETRKDETLFCTHDLNAPKTIRTLPPPKETLFPELVRLRQMIPTYPDDKVTKIAVDPKRMADFLSAMAACTGDNDPVVMLEVPKDGKGAIVAKALHSTDAQAIGAVMPFNQEKVGFVVALAALGLSEDNA